MSLLWAPAVIFWSYIIPEHSDIIKPTECDTSFRSNKLFKTLTALVNFYFPLLTMIIISCRIMIAIRSRSTMEFGRRISSSTQKQMKRERTFTNTSFMRHENQTSERKQLSSDGIDEQPMSIILNPLNSINTNATIDENTDSSFQNNDDHDSLYQFNLTNKSSSSDKTHFRFSHLKPIQILFPALSSIKEMNKRKSEDVQKQTSYDKTMKNSFSVENNMKYCDRQANITPINLNQSSRTSTFSEESPNKLFGNPIEQQISIPTEENTM
jgi:hypothetical protein